MSMANAINVMSAARKEVKEDNNVKVTCVEKDRRKATNITAVAVGCLSEQTKSSCEEGRKTDRRGGLRARASMKDR